MKKNLLTTLAAVLVTAFTAFADEKKAGPNGGRLLTNVSPNAEFLVLEDRKVKINFVGTDGKVVPAADQVVTVVTGERSAPVKLTFTKSGDSLVSNAAIPDGGAVPTVVQIKVTPEASAVISKFNVNTAFCPGCKLAEYACTCDH